MGAFYRTIDRGQQSYQRRHWRKRIWNPPIRTIWNVWLRWSHLTGTKVAIRVQTNSKMEPRNTTGCHSSVVVPRPNPLQNSSPSTIQSCHITTIPATILIPHRELAGEVSIASKKATRKCSPTTSPRDSSRWWNDFISSRSCQVKKTWIRPKKGEALSRIKDKTRVLCWITSLRICAPLPSHKRRQFSLWICKQFRTTREPPIACDNWTSL